MQESKRLAYLALLGIEQWLPRDAVQGTVDVEPAASGSVTASASVPAPVSPAAVPPPPAVGEAPADRLDALLAMASPAPPALPASLARAQNDAPASTPAATTAAAPATRATAPGERIGCALLALPGGLLLVAEFASPDAPGLTSAEHAMFLRLAAALVPGQALPSPRDFTWPPAGVRVPGMDRPGAAREALRALLEEQRRRGLRDVAVLGEGAAVVFRALVDEAGLPSPVCTFSLAAMLEEPDRKRACWTALAPLKRDMPV